jgi:hypothetical protein
VLYAPSALLKSHETCLFTCSLPGMVFALLLTHSQCNDCHYCSSSKKRSIDAEANINTAPLTGSLEHATQDTSGIGPECEKCQAQVDRCRNQFGYMFWNEIGRGQWCMYIACQRDHNDVSRLSNIPFSCVC